jgi:hypothetical protein
MRCEFVDGMAAESRSLQAPPRGLGSLRNGLVLCSSIEAFAKQTRCQFDQRWTVVLASDTVGSRVPAHHAHTNSADHASEGNEIVPRPARREQYMPQHISRRFHPLHARQERLSPTRASGGRSSGQASKTILDQSPTCCPSPGHLFRCCNPLNLLDFFSLAHSASSCCSATNVALWRLLTRPVHMVALPWHSCLGPKCPCAGSLALKALIEAEASYTPTRPCLFQESRGHESLGYPDPSAVVWLTCRCCSLPQAK